MSSELRELYQEVILDHNKNPRNFHPIADADREVEGFNPLCGDRYTVYVKLKGDTIKDAAFQGSGCAISKASASLMTECVIGKTLEEATDLFHCFHDLLTRKDTPDLESERLGEIAALAGVRDFPMRIKCATLAWHALKAAIEKRDRLENTVTTE